MNVAVKDGRHNGSIDDAQSLYPSHPKIGINHCIFVGANPARAACVLYGRCSPANVCIDLCQTAARQPGIQFLAPEWVQGTLMDDLPGNTEALAQHFDVPPF
jgi:hypothetical protein